MATDLTAMDTMDTGLMAMDTTERGLLRPRPSPLPMLLLMPLPRLIPGMGITAMVDTEAMVTELMAMVAITGHMAMEDTTMERGLLRPSPLPMLLLRLLLRPIPGTDTMAMASTDLMAMDTTDTDLMAMDDTTTERSKKCDFCQTAAN